MAFDVIRPSDIPPPSPEVLARDMASLEAFRQALLRALDAGEVAQYCVMTVASADRCVNGLSASGLVFRIRKLLRDGHVAVGSLAELLGTDK